MRGGREKRRPGWRGRLLGTLPRMKRCASGPGAADGRPLPVPSFAPHPAFFPTPTRAESLGRSQSSRDGSLGWREGSEARLPHPPSSSGVPRAGEGEGGCTSPAEAGGAARRRPAGRGLWEGPGAGPAPAAGRVSPLRARRLRATAPRAAAPRAGPGGRAAQRRQVRAAAEARGRPAETLRKRKPRAGAGARGGEAAGLAAGPGAGAPLRGLRGQASPCSLGSFGAEKRQGPEKKRI